RRPECTGAGSSRGGEDEKAPSSLPPGSQSLCSAQQSVFIFKETLADIEKKFQHAEQELRSKSREIQLLEGEIEHLERQRKILLESCTSISKENIELQMLIQEEEDNAQLTLGKFDMYRKKMKGHRDTVLQAMSQTETHRELEEKRMLVCKLRQEKEQLRKDLQNPNDNTPQMRELLDKKVAIAERREHLKNEFETHAKLKKDIEIQNRRHEAIVKRLRSQLSRAQAVHR
uniref:Uncharacterized protein n=1 Tax=Fundulus heteroclitus TaxID=8078 RepID=A0A3Q2PU58_FUNHE